MWDGHGLKRGFASRECISPDRAMRNENRQGVNIDNGYQEADPFESKISNESPIAQALFNHKVGDLVTVESPNGNYQVEIIDIK